MRNRELISLNFCFLFRARKIAKKILRLNPFLTEAILLKKGMEKEWFRSPFKKKFEHMIYYQTRPEIGRDN